MNEVILLFISYALVAILIAVSVGIAAVAEYFFRKWEDK